MERQAGPTHLWAVPIFDFNRTPPSMVVSVSNNAEHAATEDAKEPPVAQTDARADYTVRVAKLYPDSP